MLCLRQKEAKPGMENRDQTRAKRSCWVPQEWAPHGLLLSWVPGGQMQTDSPTTGGSPPLGFPGAICQGANHFNQLGGWLGELISSNQDNDS